MAGLFYSIAGLERLRVKELIAAGYNPGNHPHWATIEWLESRKREAHEEHAQSLRRYLPDHKAS